MKKLLIMFLTFALCATVVACAGQGATETTAEPTTEPTETTASSWDAGLNTGSSYGCAIDEYHAE